MSDSQGGIIRQRIDSGPFTLLQISVVAQGFLLNLIDGFDVVAMSVAAPSLTTEWAITPEEKGYILSAALFGMTLGAMFLAPIADAIGRRHTLVIATVMIGGSMILTGLIPQSVPLIVALRVISGLGVGMVLPNAAAIATEFSPERYRNMAVMGVTLGYPFGAMVVGPVANAVIPAFGWQTLFIAGGVLTLGMTAILFFFLPESVEYLAARKTHREANLRRINAILARLKRSPVEALPPPDEKLKPAHVGSLFAKGMGPATIGLWTVFFMGFFTVYFLLSWIPTLFVNSGYEQSEGVEALTLFNLGAVIGVAAINVLALRMRLSRAIGLKFFLAAASMIALYFYTPQALPLLFGVVFIIGLFIHGAFTAMYALTARYYPTEVRATGVGWGVGLGRTGAILSPIVAGYLVAAGWGMYGLFMVFGAPLVLSAIIVSRYRV